MMRNRILSLTFIILRMPPDLARHAEWLVETHSDGLYGELKRFFLKCGLRLRVYLYGGKKVIHAYPPSAATRGRA